MAAERIALALQTLPEGVEPSSITLQPTPGATWNTGTIPPLGTVIRAHYHYFANKCGVDVLPYIPGVVVGYFVEHGYQYAVTQFPGKAVLVAAVDIVEVLP